MDKTTVHDRLLIAAEQLNGVVPEQGSHSPQPSHGCPPGQQPIHWHTWQSEQDLNDRKVITSEMCECSVSLCALGVSWEGSLNMPPNIFFARSHELFALYNSLSQMAHQWQNKLQELLKRLEEELYLAQSKVCCSAIVNSKCFWFWGWAVTLTGMCLTAG
jgi:hypothetical protein